jgi:hypothetical protein
MAGTAQATTVLCANSAAAVCSFDGSGGGWNNVKVAKKTTATQSFALLLNSPGTLNVTISSTYLDLISLSFGGVTLTGITKGDIYSFAVMPSNTPQLLTVVMKNTKTKDYGYSSQLDFAPVPEPAAWGLMIAGFGMAGGALRRRRTERVAIA